MRPKRTPSGISPEHLALGRAIREIRVIRRLSQEELGFRAKAHRNYVGAVERGEVNPTFRTLMRISAGLDVRLSSLIRLCERSTDGLMAREKAHRAPYDSSSDAGSRSRTSPSANGTLSRRPPSPA